MTYQKPIKRVRVLDSTFLNPKETKSMIGGEFEVKAENYDDKTVSVWNKDKSEFWWFNQ